MTKLATKNNISLEYAKNEIFHILNTDFNAENNLKEIQKEIIEDIILDNIDKFNSDNIKTRITLIINIISLAVNMMKNNTNDPETVKYLESKLYQTTEDLKSNLDIHDPESEWSKKLQSFQLDDPDKIVDREPQNWREVMQKIRQSNKQSLIRISQSLKDKRLTNEADYLDNIIDKY
jgi:hypothetical protein